MRNLLASIVALGALGSVALADGPAMLTAGQMDGVTAGETPLFPTSQQIFLLPDGSIVFADNQGLSVIAPAPPLLLLPLPLSPAPPVPTTTVLTQQGNVVFLGAIIQTDSGLGSVASAGYVSGDGVATATITVTQ